jgi:hypothetical protein
MMQGSAPQAITQLLPKWFQPSTLTIIWFGLFAVQNYMEIQQTNTSHGWRDQYPDDDREPWKSR